MSFLGSRRDLCVNFDFFLARVTNLFSVFNRRNSFWFIIEIERFGCNQMLFKLQILKLDSFSYKFWNAYHKELMPINNKPLCVTKHKHGDIKLWTKNASKSSTCCVVKFLQQIELRV